MELDKDSSQVQNLIDYMSNVSSMTIDVDKDILYKELVKEENVEKLKQFTTTESSNLISITQIDTDNSSEEEKEEAGKIIIESSFEYRTEPCQTIIFMKKGEKVDCSNKSKIKKNLQLLNFTSDGQDKSVFDSMQNYVQSAMTKIFTSYKNKIETDINPASKVKLESFKPVQEKLNELSSLINQAQKNEVIKPIYLEPLPALKSLQNELKNSLGRDATVEEVLKAINESKNLDVANINDRIQNWESEINPLTVSVKRQKNDFAFCIDEINYWRDLLAVLKNAKEQIESPDVQMALSISQASNTVSKISQRFQANTNLDANIKGAYNIYCLLKEMPIVQLTTAVKIPEIEGHLVKIFETFISKMKNTDEYSISRMFSFIKTLSKDMNDHLIELFGNKLLSMDYDKFYDLYKSTKNIFEKCWDVEYSKLEQEAKILLKSRNETMLNKVESSDFEHTKLAKRLKEINRFRKDHRNLISITKSLTMDETNPDAESPLVRQIKLNYSQMDESNLLDLTIDGQTNWIKQKDQNFEENQKVEREIARSLTEQLSAAQNEFQLFNIFKKFKKVLSSKSVQNAIQEYQSKYVKYIEKNLNELKEKFFQGYFNSSACVMNKVKGIPEKPGIIIWQKQFVRKVNVYKENLNIVLGEQWEKQVDKKHIANLCEIIIKNATPCLEDWCKEVINRGNFELYKERVIGIIAKQTGYELKVNFDEKAIDLYKEQKFFKSLNSNASGFYTCGNNLFEFKKAYPYAISLDDAFKTFNNILLKIKNDSDTNKLIAKQKIEIHDIIRKNIDISFNQINKFERFTKEFSNKISKLNETVRDLIDYNSQINTILSQIAKCEMDKDIIANKIKEIQTIIDNVTDCSNVKLWIKGIDAKLEAILVKKLEEIINTWLTEFISPKPMKEPPKLLKDISVHKIKMIDQIICVEPNLNVARKIWYNEFHQIMSIVCSNLRLRYRLEDSTKKTESETTYKEIILKIDPALLEKGYKTLEDTIEEGEKYVNHWLNYQVLWNLQPENIYGRIGDDMEKWQELMNDVKVERRTFDNNETEKVFGSIIIDYSTVQTKIMNKYDTFHKEILSKFANQTNDALKAFYQTISDARNVLESNSVDNVNTDIVQFITEVQEVKNNCKKWEEEMNKYKNSKKILDKQRYHFPPSFTNMDQVESEWSKLKQILEKKSKSMNEQIPIIQGRISDESVKIEKKIKELENFWNNNKPYKIDNPTEALKILTSANTMLNNVKNDYVKNCKAKELLEMEFSDPNKLEGIEEDIQDLKEVWTGLNAIWIKVDSLKETPFAAVQADKIKVSIDDALKEMSALPAKMRTYEAYECVENKLQSLKKENAIIADLRSPAIKERHWKTLKEILKLKKDENEFILEDFWKVNLLRLEKKLRDVIDTATGELILENFIKKSKENWGNFELELIQYKQKCKLIRGWDDMFSKLDEDINMFQSMANSPHYGIFKDDIEPWKDKLEKARLIFNEWVDVQRRWVYLEGIFFGSSDIMNDLASDYNKFKAIDNEFTGLMKKVAAKPFILPVISIPSIKSILEEKLKTSLERIQKSLYNFLDKQRQNFARFYFIGDEDLLEIIGNSKVVSKITRHFNKMFAGMNSLLTKDNDGNELIAMTSREQEVVNFETSIKISDDPIIYKWLGKVQSQMQITLATKLEKAVLEISQMDYIHQVDSFIKWIEKYPAQITVLSSQVLWSASIESALKKEKLLSSLPDNFTLENEESVINNMLSALSDQVLKDIKVDMRKKLEQLITELVHQRDVVRLLMSKNISDANDFDWLYYMRFYFNPKTPDVLKRLQIKMSNAPFDYGFEYLGVAEKLIQTPLTDRCYLTLTQGLNFKFGGAPFGPAGTGKTESVKALGGQLGRFVLVFNCDEKFDFKAMGRIFVGLCQVGAWGCFDEFNRLEERILSAVSQQILVIQTGLKESSTQIDLMGKVIKLNHQMGIFITMNPGYAGRSQLPDNLKQLFRQMAMIKPDRDMIAQVTLYSQGYKTAERLSSKMVSLFELCGNQLSSQPHYDFGLRALKSVLVNAGNLKRLEEKKKQENKDEKKEDVNIEKWEQDILLKSVCNTIIPKLVKEDLSLFQSLLTGVFPDAKIEEVNLDELKNKLIELCKIRNLIPEESFISKIIQLYSIQNMNRLMLVGGTGTGKSAALSLLFEALQSLTKKKGEKYIIDPKAVNKDILYGTLDPTTLDWTDGVFTGILRKILDNQRGEMDKLHWIIFDGDVDPEWAENLNSVLDDNKLLTLPHGDRLSIPPNVRIMFEVESLKYATLATVSRCGMIWFSDGVVSIDMMYEHYLKRLQQEKYEDANNYSEGASNDQMFKAEGNSEDENAGVRKKAVDALRPFFEPNGFVTQALTYVENIPHIMEFTRMRALNGMFALLRKGILNIIEYNDNHSSFPMEDQGIVSCMQKWLVISLIWGFGGSLNLKNRTEFSNKLKDFTCDITFPQDNDFDLIDYGLRYEDQSWETYKSRVPNVELDSSKVSNADLVITTVDTVRHQEILCSWIRYIRI